MREFRSSGSVRGVPSNGHPYRDSSPKSYAKTERSMNDVVVGICEIGTLWIAVDMRQF
jgi:hypothetical protein